MTIIRHEIIIPHDYSSWNLSARQLSAAYIQKLETSGILCGNNHKGKYLVSNLVINIIL